MMITNTLRIALISGIGLSLLFGSNADAERVEVSVGAGAHFVPMDSMDALSSDTSFMQFRLGVGLLLPELEIVPDTRTELVLEYQSGTLTGQSFQAIDSELELSTIAISGRIRKQVFTKLSAFVQAGVGWQRSTVTLKASGNDSERRLQGDSNALSGLASIGSDFAVLTRANSPFGLSLRAEIGYQASTSLSMDASPSDGDSLSIATQSSELGSVNSSGTTLKWGLVGTF